MRFPTPNKVDEMLQDVYELYFEKHTDPSWTYFDFPTQEKFKELVEDKLNSNGLSLTKRNYFFRGLKFFIQDRLKDTTIFGFETISYHKEKSHVKSEDVDLIKLTDEVDFAIQKLESLYDWLEEKLYELNSFKVTSLKPKQIVAFLIESDILDFTEVPNEELAKTINALSKTLVLIYGKGKSSYLKSLRAYLNETGAEGFKGYDSYNPMTKEVLESISIIVNEFHNSKNQNLVQYHKIYPISWDK